MALFDKQDWKLWFKKLKWELISFKFLSFRALVILLILSWFSLSNLHETSIEVAKTLHTEKFIETKDVSGLITHSQTVLYDKALSHLLVFFGAVLAAVIAIKGVSYWTESKQTSEVIKKLNGDTTKDDLKKFLPRRKQE